LYKVLLVSLGGFVGAGLRYLVSEWTLDITKSLNFPHGTLVVNLIGCMMIGFLTQVADRYALFTPETRLFLFIGILGAFTTFSTFSNETFTLFNQGNDIAAIINISAHVILGLAMVWIGRFIAQWVM